MPHAHAYNLALPPRPVPWPVRAQLFLGGVLNQVGWIVAGFGMIFFWIFGINSDLGAIRFFLSPSQTGRGVISISSRMRLRNNCSMIPPIPARL